MTRISAVTRWLVRTLAFALAIAIAVVIVRANSGAVQPKDLANLIDRADKLVVLQEPHDGAAVLFESSNRLDLDDLKASLRVERPDHHLHCMCDGTPAIFLYASGEKIGQVTNHHAKLVRCGLWKSDALLMDTEALLTWFDNRNIPGPRMEYKAALKRQKEEDEQERKWVDAMPAAIRPLWPANAKNSPDHDISQLRGALAKQDTPTDLRCVTTALCRSPPAVCEHARRASLHSVRAWGGTGLG